MQSISDGLSTLWIKSDSSWAVTVLIDLFKVSPATEKPNELDKAARKYDFVYKNHKEIKTRHIADKILEQKALERYNDPDSSMSEQIPAI